MKIIFTIIAALHISSAVFALSTTDSLVDNSITFITSGSVVKVIYSSDKESNICVTITDLKGKEVFSESVRSKNGFSRRYNLSQLGSGRYVVMVSDGRESRSETIILQSKHRIAGL